MSKLMFLVQFNDVTKSTGIIEKVITQSKYMNEEGMLYKTFILYDRDQKEFIQIYDKYKFIEFVPIEFYKISDSKIKKIFLIEKIYKELDKICLKEKGKYDYIYMRFNPLFLGFIKLVRKHRYKFIFEHNSIEREEYKANKSINTITSILFDKYVRKYAFGYVAVTKQIHNYQKKLYNNIEGISISNGVEVLKYPQRIPPKYDNKNINLLFIGNIRYWHGLDRIIYSISNYNGDKNVTLNIYGPINEKDALSSLIKKLNVEDRVKQNGYKSKDEMDELFNSAHVAIGSLGCYKKNIDYACTLKNREYFSRGIPVVFSEIDQDIPMEYDKKYFLKVENNDTIFDLQNIVDFVDNLYSSDINKITKDIRDYALRVMDYRVKIKKLKEYISEQERKNNKNS